MDLYVIMNEDGSFYKPFKGSVGIFVHEDLSSAKQNLIFVKNTKKEKESETTKLGKFTYVEDVE